MEFDHSTDTINPDDQPVITIGGTGGMVLPSGTTAQRPGSPALSTFRWNSDVGSTEMYVAPSTWILAGTVTSVGLTSSGIYAGAITVGSSPITQSGNITITPNVFGTSAPGVVPQSGGGTTNFLRADGTWAAPAGGGTVTSVAVSGGTTGLTTSGGPITGAGTITLAGTLIAANGGTGLTTYGVGDILYAATTTTLGVISPPAVGNVLKSNGTNTAPSFGKLALNTSVSGTLAVANGGTNLSATPTNGQLLIGNGTGFTLAGLTAGANITITPGAGSITIAATGGGGGSPGGATGTVQYNNAGSFGGATYVTIDNNELTIGANGSPITPGPSTAKITGTLDDGVMRLDYVDPNGEVVRLSRDQVITIRNNSGSTITKGQWVYVSGASGSRVRVALARADSDATIPALGVVMDTIASGGDGRCLAGGIITKVDTSAFVDGDRLFLSTTTAGGVTNTPPSSGFKQRVGIVLNAGATNGSIYVTSAGASPRQDNVGYLWIIEAPDGTIPTAPTDGNVIFSRTIANRRLPAFVGPSGLDSALQPLIARNKIGYWNPQGNATTVPGVFGFTAPTAVGTATARNVATTNYLTRMRRLGYVSAAAAGSLCGHYVSVAQYTTGTGGTNLGGFTLVVRFGISDASLVSGARMFVGLTSSTAAPTNVDPSGLTNCVGVAQLSTDATQLYIVYAGSAAQADIALGSTNFSISNTRGYELALFSPPSTTGVVNWMVTSLDSGVSASGTISGAATVIPQATTLLAYRAWRTNNATASACGLDVCSIYIETDQ